MTSIADSETFKKFMMRDMRTNRKNMISQPESKDNRHLFFIDDLNMCKADKFDVKRPHELLRSFFDYNGWYSTKEKSFNKIKHIQFIASVSLREESV